MEAAAEPLDRLPLPLTPRPAGARPRLAVVLPAYNEAELIPRVCDELAAVLDGLPVCWTLLFVNDGSSDDSYEVLEAMHRRDGRVGHLSLSRNFGHQAALAAGLENVDADVVITMDADLQHPPALIPDLFRLWQAGYDVVHTRKTDTLGLATWRRAATSLAYGLVSRIARARIVPNASDFRLFDRSVAEALRALPEAAPLHRGLIPWLGFRQCVVPYVAGERQAGRSKYTLRQFAGLFGRALFDFSDASLHLGILLGGTALALSFAYLVFILGWMLFGKSAPPGWASTMSVTLVLNSITLAFLGIIGIYVARIYREVRRRPSYVVGRRCDPVGGDR